MKSFLLNILGALALVFVTGGLWMYMSVDRASLRYRLTYEVEVNGAVRSGSGVVGLSYEDTQKLPLPNTGAGAQAVGEAVVIDLGGGRHLFSLLDVASTMPLLAFPDKNLPQDSIVDFARKLAHEKPTASLPFSKAPRLVTFTDINDPKTVKLVDPANLSATFGAGVKLKRIKVEITEDDVTRGEVEKVLAWLDWPRERLLALGGGENPVKFQADGLTIFLDKPSFRSGQ